MRWIDGLSKPQRVVVVIALGIALGALGSYLVNLGSGFGSGWTGYAPLTSAPLLTRTGVHPWLRLIIWLVLIGAWAVGSVRVLRPSSEDVGDRP